MIMISTTTKQSTCDTKENKNYTVRSLIMIYTFPNVTPFTSRTLTVPASYLFTGVLT